MTDKATDHEAGRRWALVFQGDAIDAMTPEQRQGMAEACAKLLGVTAMVTEMYPASPSGFDAGSGEPTSVTPPAEVPEKDLELGPPPFTLPPGHFESDEH